MSFDSVDFTPSADGTLDNMKYGGINVSEIAQELKDNCDDAGAKNISIYMLAKDSKELSNLNEFIILDDGRGMDQENLWNSMRLAHRHQHGSEDIGKFGVGLKNATIGLGDEIIIITRSHAKGQGEAKTLGVFLNINDMRRQNTFKPTQFVDDGSLLKGWFPSSIWELFNSQTSGTMILVKSIHNHHVHDVSELATNVHRSLNFNYSASANASNASNTKVYYSLDNHLDVKHVDAFYRNDPSACAFVYEAELRVYKNGREDTVYEVVTSNRLRGRKLIRATESKPLFYKFSALKKGTQADKDGAHAEVPILPDTPYKKMTIRFIEVSEDAYNKEGKTGDWDGFDTRRRGFFFRRGTRMVGSCMALEEKMDDWSNRFRMEVTFAPDLDLEMGVRTQKQMSKSVHAACISDSLRILWRQLVGPRIRERKADKVASDSESEDKDVKKGTLNSFINISKKSPTPADDTPVPSPTPVTHDLPQSDDELSITDGAYVERTESSEEFSDELADQLADQLAGQPAGQLADKLADNLAGQLADKPADESTIPEPPYDIDISNDSVQLKQGGKVISTIPGFSSASDLRDWIFRSTDPVALVNHIAKFFLDQKN